MRTFERICSRINAVDESLDTEFILSAAKLLGIET